MRNSKKWIWVIGFLVLWIVVNQILTFLLCPYSYARIDIHNLESGGYEDLFIGSSHGKCGIDPEVVDQVTGRKSINMCLGGEYPLDAYYLVREALRVADPKRIIYELDPGYWQTKANQGMDYDAYYRELPLSSVKIEYYFAKFTSADFRGTLFPWYLYRKKMPKALQTVKTKLSDTYKNYGTEPFDNKIQTYEPTGFINRKVIPNAVKNFNNIVSWNQQNLKESAVENFDKIVDLCREEGVELIVITTPIPQETLQNFVDNYAKSEAFFSEFMTRRGIRYHNFNYVDLPGFDKSLNGYADCDGHMYGSNAQIFSKILGEYLNTCNQ